MIALVKVLNIPEADIDYSIDEDIGLWMLNSPIMPYDKLEEEYSLKTFEVGIKSIMKLSGYIALHTRNCKYD